MWKVVVGAAVVALTLCASARAEPFPLKRCINLGNALEAPSYEGEWGYQVRWPDIVRIKQAGFDSVRLPVRFSAYTSDDPPYAIDPKLLTRVDEIIGWAEAQNLGLSLDLHHYNDLYDDPQKERPRFLAIWKQLAERYRDHGPNLVFEVLNEPQGEEMDAEPVMALQAEVLAEIRKSNPTRWVSFSGPRWASVDGLEGWRPPNDPYAMASISFYEPMNFTHQYAHFMDAGRLGHAWGRHEDVETLRARVDEAANWAKTTGVPLFVGEFGSYEANTLRQRAAWAKAARHAFDANEMGWCAWDYAGAFKIYDTNHEKWMKPIKDALLK